MRSEKKQELNEIIVRDNRWKCTSNQEAEVTISQLTERISNLKLENGSLKSISDNYKKLHKIAEFKLTK